LKKGRGPLDEVEWRGGDEDNWDKTIIRSEG